MARKDQAWIDLCSHANRRLGKFHGDGLVRQVLADHQHEIPKNLTNELERRLKDALTLSEISDDEKKHNSWSARNAIWRQRNPL